MDRKSLRPIVVSVAGLLSSLNVYAARIASDQLAVTDPAVDGKVSATTDDDLATRWRDSGQGLLIDLGGATVVHRVYLHPGTDPEKRVKTLRLSFLDAADDADPLTLKYTSPDCAWWKVKQARRESLARGEGDFLPAVASFDVKDGPGAEVSLKFNPVKARYLRIEGPAEIAELEVYGGTQPEAFEKRDAVVLPANTPELLNLAAEELRYYLGELTGRPLPIITPEQEQDYPGTLYIIEDLKPLAPDYDEMHANLRSGKLPTGGPLPESIVSLHTMRLPDGVNVERDGRRVVFRAWPYRNVLLSVWEFLRRQGVIWAYPGTHGDYLPTGNGVELGVLPLRWRPSAEWRNANYRIKEAGIYPYTDAFLYFVRNGYDSSWGELERFWDQHNEVPPIPATVTRTKDEVKPEHEEGFGKGHNFNAVIPGRILEQHPDWCGMTADGRRLPPHKGGPSTFCLTSTGAMAFVADKILDWVGPHRECRMKFDLLPMDSATFCRCDRCRELYRTHEVPSIPYCARTESVSDAYYHFISEVAERVRKEAPKVRIGTLAYADYHAPPPRIDRLPPNVWVRLCQYGSRNLPFSSPANERMRKRTETWAAKVSTLQTYSYQLIEGEWMELPMPIPSVAAISDRAKHLYRLKAWNGGTQSWTHCLPHNPWNHYAYVTMLRDVEQRPEQMLRDFFNAYYREAADPMLAYYKALESHLLRNHIDLQNFGYDQGPHGDAFPPDVVAAMRAALAKAASAARSWYVKERIDQARRDLDWAVPASRRRSPDKATALKYGKKDYPCKRRQGTIQIDGKTDDAAWENAPAAGAFIKPKTHEPAAESTQSEFRMLWDDDNLYIAVKCLNPTISELQETDAIWGKNTDSLELFLVPVTSDPAVYYQWGVSAFNRTFGPSRFFRDQFHKDANWEGAGVKTATRIGDGFWSCEIAIAFRDLAEDPPGPGDTWRVNIARNNPEAASSWSPLQFGAWHLQRDFNFVSFKGE